jgi:hypothetical protein
MADLKNYILGSLLFMAIVTGMFYSMNDWFTRSGSAPLDNPVNTTFSGPSNYLNKWSNDTSAALSKAQDIPLFGGSFVLLTGGFQALTLLVGLPTQVMLPIVTSVTTYVGVSPWVVPFLTAVILISVLIALLNAMKGGAV